MIEIRYKKSGDPIQTDGRHVDPRIAELTGEGAQQLVKTSGDHARVWRQLPVPGAADPTYYDRPMLKQPVWEFDIPLYYYIGGAAGASLAIGAAAQLDRSGKLDNLMRRCHWAGIIGSGISAVLLIHDLGRPSRFANMLRVFRPTSPMNMGAWILSAISPSAIAAAMFARKKGILGAFGEVSGIASGMAGLGLATYTGVLVGNTAVPLWQESRRILPILFGASAMASAGSLFDLFFEDPEARRVTFTFGTIGRAVELAAGIAMERQAEAAAPIIARPLKQGTSGLLWKTGEVLNAASLITGIFAGKSRKRRVAAGVMGTLGSLALRFAVHKAGFASALDPRASFHQQRAGHGGEEERAPLPSRLKDVTDI